MYKRIIFFLFLSFCACLGIYVKYFRRPPTADILNANKRSAGTDSNEDSEMTGLSEPAKQSRRHWNSWIKANDFVQIGEVHNKCDGADKLTMGRVILLQDAKTKGLTSKTYLNITFEYDITGGQMFLECKYNSRQLFSGHWDLCTAEEDVEESERVIFCPLTSGSKTYAVDRKIPGYLPTGRYEAKAWFVDQKENIIACGMADFTI